MSILIMFKIVHKSVKNNSIIAKTEGPFGALFSRMKCLIHQNVNKLMIGYTILRVGEGNFGHFYCYRNNLKNCEYHDLLFGISLVTFV